MPPLNLYDPDYPIYTHARFLPGTKINDCKVEQSILCEGSIITKAEIKQRDRRHPRGRAGRAA